MLKAITHLHTHYSFDCAVAPKRIVDKAVKLGVNYLLITDHDSLEGSIEAAAYAAKKGYAINIPIAAEYSTNIGDLIVLGVKPDFERKKDHVLLCEAAKEQSGITILPHPYKGHRLEAVDFSLIDCIEVFNSRCSFKENMQAYELAQGLNKPMIYSSDAHTLTDIGNAIFAFQGENPFCGHTTPLRLMSTPTLHNEYSRIIRGAKLGKPKEVLRAIKRCLVLPWHLLSGTSNEL